MISSKRFSLSVVVMASIALVAIASPVRSSIGARLSSIAQEEKEYIPASEYIQDGCYAIFDAIENVGEGVHDSSSIVWVDLIGGLQMQMSAASWTDNSYRCVEVNMGYVSRDAMPEYPQYPVFMTIEVVVQNCHGNSRNRNSLVFGGYSYKRMNMARSSSDGIWGMSYGKNGFFFSDQGTITAVFIDSSGSSERTIYINGGMAEETDAYKENFGNTAVQAISINPRGDYPFNGEVCCIRLYTRRLDEDEILHNASIDKVRFSLP